VQPRLRLWIGGQGEKRLPPPSGAPCRRLERALPRPEVFAQRNATLDRWCEREGRDPRAITRTANLGLALGRDEPQVRRQEESLPPDVRPHDRLRAAGIPGRRAAQVIERIREYAAAGAEWVILALRAPFDWEGLELFIQEVMPAFQD